MRRTLCIGLTSLWRWRRELVRNIWKIWHRITSVQHWSTAAHGSVGEWLHLCYLDVSSNVMSDWTFSVCCCCFGDQKSVWLDQIPGNPAQPRVTVEKWSKNFDERPHCHRGSTNFSCGKIALCGPRTIPPPPLLSLYFPTSSPSTLLLHICAEKRR